MNEDGCVDRFDYLYCVQNILQLPMMMMNPFPFPMILRLSLSTAKLMQRTFDLFPTEAKIIAQSYKNVICLFTTTTTTSTTTTQQRDNIYDWTLSFLSSEYLFT
jgi:hypothetical protein